MALNIFQGGPRAHNADETSSMASLLGASPQEATQMGGVGNIQGMLQQFFAQAMMQKMKTGMEKKALKEEWFNIMSSPNFSAEQKKQATMEAAANGVDMTGSDGNPLFQSSTGQKWLHGGLQTLDNLALELIPDSISGMADTGYGDMGTAENVADTLGFLSMLIPGVGAWKGAGLALKGAKGAGMLAKGAAMGKGAFQGSIGAYKNIFKGKAPWAMTKAEKESFKALGYGDDAEKILANSSLYERYGGKKFVKEFTEAGGKLEFTPYHIRKFEGIHKGIQEFKMGDDAIALWKKKIERIDNILGDPKELAKYTKKEISVMKEFSLASKNGGGVDEMVKGIKDVQSKSYNSNLKIGYGESESGYKFKKAFMKDVDEVYDAHNYKKFFKNLDDLINNSNPERIGIKKIDKISRNIWSKGKNDKGFSTTIKDKVTGEDALAKVKEELSGVKKYQSGRNQGGNILDDYSFGKQSKSPQKKEVANRTDEAVEQAKKEDDYNLEDLDSYGDN